MNTIVTKIKEIPSVSDPNQLLLVAEGIVKMIESKGSAEPKKDGGKTSEELYNCLWFNDGKYELLTDGTPYGMMLCGYKPYIPVIISLYDLPVDGDWVYYNNGVIEKTSKDKFPAKESIALGYYKILALPSQLSARFLYEHRMVHNLPVLVECEIDYDSVSCTTSIKQISNTVIKLDSDNRVIVHNLFNHNSKKKDQVFELKSPRVSSKDGCCGIPPHTIIEAPGAEKAIQIITEPLDDVVNEDKLKGYSIQFLMWLARNYPDAIIKHADDEDGGETAFATLYDYYLSSKKRENK